MIDIMYIELKFSSQEIVLRPLICAQPSNFPGFTSCRFCSSGYKGKYSIKNRRGPTKLICPKIHLSIGVIHLSESLRINFPKVGTVKIGQ